MACLERINQFRAVGKVPQAACDDAEIATRKAHISVAGTVLTAADLLFEVGGASSVQQRRPLDRHWRNARTLAVDNPAIYKERAVGDHLLNGAEPTYYRQIGQRQSDGR